jgi:DNA topoisomerase II
MEKRHAEQPHFHHKVPQRFGCTTSKEAKEYFQNMDRHRILFTWANNTDDDAILMAFSKKCIDQRKVWLTKHMEECKHRKLVGLPDRYLYTKTTKEVSYADFVNLELVEYSNAANIRCIPSVVDGLKPSQRKALFASLKRNDKRDVRVDQLSGSVREMAAYHNDESSLCETIVNLNQN